MPFILFTQDIRPQHWLFWTHDAAGCLIPRVEFKDLVCAECGKLDELAALARGVPASLKIKSRHDFISSDDDFVLVSAWARTFLASLHLQGVEFLSMPSDPNYFVLLPTCLLPTADLTSFTIVGEPCASCGRYREVAGFPELASRPIPTDGSWLFGSQFRSESVRGRRSLPFVTDDVASAIVAAKLTGVELSSAG